MAGIRFECPYCNKVSRVPDQYAGKKGKCPACKKVIEVPDPDLEDDGGFVPEDASPAKETKECKFCGETIKKVAKKCRHCGEFLSKGGRSQNRKRSGGYAACPTCRDGGRGAEAVNYTWWGGLIGPRILSHVKCLSCGGKYNGKTGKSNNTAIGIYFAVTFVIVLVILVAAA